MAVEAGRRLVPRLEKCAAAGFRAYSNENCEFAADGLTATTETNVTAECRRLQMSKECKGSVPASVLAGGLLLAFHVPVRAGNDPMQEPDDTSGKFAPNAFIRIDSTGKTTLIMPQVEMGQGIYTAVATILAEEVDADAPHHQRGGYRHCGESR
jgi:hypothetical protein